MTGEDDPSLGSYPLLTANPSSSPAAGVGWCFPQAASGTHRAGRARTGRQRLAQTAATSRTRCRPRAARCSARSVDYRANGKQRQLLPRRLDRPLDRITFRPHTRRARTGPRGRLLRRPGHRVRVRRRRSCRAPATTPPVLVPLDHHRDRRGRGDRARLRAGRVVTLFRLQPSLEHLPPRSAPGGVGEAGDGALHRPSAVQHPVVYAQGRRVPGQPVGGAETCATALTLTAETVGAAQLPLRRRLAAGAAGRADRQPLPGERGRASRCSPRADPRQRHGRGSGRWTAALHRHRPLRLSWCGTGQKPDSTAPGASNVRSTLIFLSPASRGAAMGKGCASCSRASRLLQSRKRRRRDGRAVASRAAVAAGTLARAPWASRPDGPVSGCWVSRLPDGGHPRANFLTEAVRRSVDAGRTPTWRARQCPSHLRETCCRRSRWPSNLFAELQADLALASLVCRVLWPDLVASVEEVRFDVVTGARRTRAFLGNRSALRRRAVRQGTPPVAAASSAIEVKYPRGHDPGPGPDGQPPLRRRWPGSRACSATRTRRSFASSRCVRCWLDHLLALSLLGAEDVERVRFVLLAPANQTLRRPGVGHRLPPASAGRADLRAQERWRRSSRCSKGATDAAWVEDFPSPVTCRAREPHEHRRAKRCRNG